MEKIKKMNLETSTNNFNKVSIILLISYIILSLFIYMIRTYVNINDFILISLVILISIILTVTTYVIRLKLTYTYNNYLLILLYVITYFILPLLIFDNINYLNINEYVKQYIYFLNNSSFYLIVIINFNILLLPLSITNMLKNIKSVLHLNNKVHLILKTETYVNTFKSKNELHSFIEYLSKCENDEVLPLNKFKKIENNKHEVTSNFISLQKIYFKDCNYFKLQFTYKTKLTKLIKLDIYSNVYELKETK